MTLSSHSNLDKFRGTLLGTAAGDAIGLPREGLSPRRAKMFGPAPLHHRLFFRHGFLSDDTEHASMTLQALLACKNDPTRFARSLAWRLRWWLLGLPAGVGLATLKSILKLWLGFPPAKSGVNSAGNGPAMRTAILGVWAAQQESTGTKCDLASFVQSSTRLTHTDPRAYEGALLIALSARFAASRNANTIDQDALFTLLQNHITGEQLRRNLDLCQQHLHSESSASALAEALGSRRGVSGYINHTVPVALFCWLRFPTDGRRAIEESILAGGDSDSVGAIVGGLVGATSGESAIPAEWITGICDWPRSTGWLRRLADRAANPTGKPVPLFWPALFLRNILFTLIILTHGFRRLLPPY